MNRRVVVTGIGPITPIGIGKDTYWQSLVEGKSGIDKISLFDASEYPSQIAGEVRDFEPKNFIDEREIRRMDRFCHFAVAAAQLALEDAKLKITPEIANETGVIIGSGIGGLGTLEAQHKILLEKGVKRVSPFLVPMMICDLAAGYVSISTGAKGINLCTVTACASGTHAIGEAFEAIKRGAIDICITGGTEAGVTPLGVAGFCAARALSTRNDEPQKASRPFDAKRDGFVIAEGAGILILETLESALSRDAHIYGEIVGYGATGDAYHITSPSPDGEGAARAIQQALDEVGLIAEDIDYINAHGTSTQYNDEFETMAIKNIFGDHAYKLLVSSTKSMTGHALGAAGAFELIACALVIKNGIVPPTINLEYPDPLCDLNYVPNKAVKKEIKCAMSNSFGFGGHNAAIIIRQLD